MGVIKGTVKTTDDEPVPEASVMVASGPSHPDVAALTDDGGAFELGGLQSGRYVIEVNAAGYSPARGRVRVRDEGTTRVGITLQEGDAPEI